MFPGNKNHQLIFLAIFIELKYSPNGFLGTLSNLCSKYNFSPRQLETVRSKMRRLGLLDYVSRFNKKYGYCEGWVFSNRFNLSLKKLSEILENIKERKDAFQERKDRDLFLYL